MKPIRVSHKRLRAHLALSILLAGGVGCQTVPEAMHDSVRQSINQNLETAAQAKPAKEPLAIPKEVSEALLPQYRYEVPKAETDPLEPRFDLNTKAAPAKDVFLSITKGTPYSIVVPDSIDSKLTLSLKSVTVAEALEIIRSMYGYDYQRVGNRYHILEPKLHTRLFPVNYLDFNRKGSTSMNISASGLTAGLGQSENNNGNQRQQGSGNQTGIQVSTASQSDFWKNLQTTVSEIIGSEEGRRVIVNPPAGLVIVRAMPDELRLVDEFLNITQRAINRQVVLEAKIIEVNLNDQFQSGINWAMLANANGTQVLGSQVGGGSLPSGDGVSAIAGSPVNLTPTSSALPLSQVSTNAFGGMVSFAIKSSDFTAFFELLQSQGDVQVLSSPRVSTLNNQKAVIKVGGDEFFVTSVTSASDNTSPTGANTGPTVELTPFFSGIALDVTPHIDADDNVILHIHPTVSEVSQRNKSFVVGGDDFSIPLAFSTIQESDNVVSAGSGQVIVIGGLMKESSLDNESSVPILGDVPLFGKLFQHKRVVRIKKELVILLKPTVINHNNGWSDQIRATSERMLELKRVDTQ